MPSKKHIADIDNIADVDVAHSIPSPFTERHKRGVRVRFVSDAEVELGSQVDARTRPTAGAVVAVRVPGDLMARISEYARRRGITVSDVMREGAERLVDGTVTSPTA